MLEVSALEAAYDRSQVLFGMSFRVAAGEVATLMGRDGEDEISVHEIAKIKNSASYDVLCSWRGRLPRIYVNDEPAQ